jgi:hypothetical protein
VPKTARDSNPTVLLEENPSGGEGSPAIASPKFTNRLLRGLINALFTNGTLNADGVLELGH